MSEALRMKEALLSYAAVGPLDLLKPSEIQRDLRSIAGWEHAFRPMIMGSLCFICHHSKHHEVHNG